MKFLKLFGRSGSLGFDPVRIFQDVFLTSGKINNFCECGLWVWTRFIWLSNLSGDDGFCNLASGSIKQGRLIYWPTVQLRVS